MFKTRRVEHSCNRGHQGIRVDYVVGGHKEIHKAHGWKYSLAWNGDGPRWAVAFWQKCCYKCDLRSV